MPAFVRMRPRLARTIAAKKFTKPSPAIATRKVHFEQIAGSISEVFPNLSSVLPETLNVYLLVANTTAHAVNPIMHRNVLFAKVARCAPQPRRVIAVSNKLRTRESLVKLFVQNRPGNILNKRQISMRRSLSIRYRHLLSTPRGPDEPQQRGTQAQSAQGQNSDVPVLCQPIQITFGRLVQFTVIE